MQVSRVSAVGLRCSSRVVRVARYPGLTAVKIQTDAGA